LYRSAALLRCRFSTPVRLRHRVCLESHALGDLDSVSTAHDPAVVPADRGSAPHDLTQSVGRRNPLDARRDAAVERPGRKFADELPVRGVETRSPASAARPPSRSNSRMYLSWNPGSSSASRGARRSRPSGPSSPGAPKAAATIDAW